MIQTVQQQRVKLMIIWTEFISHYFITPVGWKGLIKRNQLTKQSNNRSSLAYFNQQSLIIIFTRINRVNSTFLKLFIAKMNAPTEREHWIDIYSTCLIKTTINMLYFCLQDNKSITNLSFHSMLFIS